MLRATDPTLALIVMVFRPVSRVGVGFDPPLQPVSPHCCYTSHLIISLKTASRRKSPPCLQPPGVFNSTWIFSKIGKLPPNGLLENCTVCYLS
jgi:hypothetical protein